ncbi:MAG: hypothetical protein CL424_02210 [Acidimicrobiaceae bacterium]|nr:hypothetical protein [Acidimicrobiaceae bacterium]
MTIHSSTDTGRSPGTDDDVGSDAAEDFIERHPGVVKFARVGWAAKGVVYLLTGFLAFTIAADPHGGGSSGEADPSGAVSTIARQPYGTILLWLMAIGLFIYAAWRIVTVVLPADLGGHAILRRVGYSVSAATYIVLGITAVSLATAPGSSGGNGGNGGSGGSQDSQVTQATQTVMEWPAGRWLVGIAGIVVIGVAAYFFHKAYTASFEKEIAHRSIGPFSWKAIRTFGRIGWVGRSVMMALIGVFVTRAAINFDPDEAQGLDDSLRKVVDSDVGMVLVLLVALGLTLYGAFCVLTAPARKVVATDEDTVAS